MQKIKYLVLCLFFLSCTSGFENRLDNRLERLINKDFGPQVAKKYNLVYMSCSLGKITDCPKVFYDLKFMGKQCLTLEQARWLAVSLACDYWGVMSTDPLFGGYLADICTRSKTYDPVLSTKRMGIKISFWDDQFDRYPKPYISQIVIAGGEISYYQAKDEDQTLEKPEIETLDQAFTKVGLAPLSF